jgi:FixJ family two-component response regulator
MAPDTTIFIVDDDPAVRDSLKVFLEVHGYSVSDFASGTEFLSNYAAGPRQCLVLDVHMPAISGIDLLERLAAQCSAPPTVVITGRGDAALKDRAIAAGAFAVLEKPFDAGALVAALCGAMTAAADGDATRATHRKGGDAIRNE